MKFTYVFLAALIAPLFAANQPALANIDIHFDYRYDDSGFFTGANSSRRDLLNAAASVFETRFQDRLTAITSSGSDKFEARFFRPDNGDSISIRDYSVAPDQIVVFPGARNLDDALATGGHGGYAGSGSEAFLDNVFSRGQAGALLPEQTDFGPWGGTISFNSTSDWYFDPDVGTEESFPGKYDFYSVAVHELAHVLGFGSAQSFDNLSSTGVFTGAAVNELFGSHPALASNGHWARGLSYLEQDAAMGPGIAANQRQHFTELDYAAMKDIGWQVSSIPEKEIWTMMLAGLGLLGWRFRVSRRGG